MPGRFEFVDHGQSFRVIVDYAHTDDALEKALTSAREITEGKLMLFLAQGVIVILRSVGRWERLLRAVAILLCSLRITHAAKTQLESSG